MSRIEDINLTSTAKLADEVVATSTRAVEFSAKLNEELFTGRTLADIQKFESMLLHMDASVFSPPSPAEVADIIGLRFPNSNIFSSKKFINTMCRPSLHTVSIHDYDDKYRLKAIHPNRKEYYFEGPSFQVRLTPAGAVVGFDTDENGINNVFSHFNIPSWSQDGEVQDVGRPIAWYLVASYVTVINGQRKYVQIFYDLPIVTCMRYGVFKEGMAKYGNESASDFTGIQVLNSARYQHDNGTLPGQHTYDYFCNKDVSEYRGLSRLYQMGFQTDGSPLVLTEHDLFMVMPSALSFVINKLYPRFDKHFNRTLSSSQLSTLVGSSSGINSIDAIYIMITKLDVMSNRYKQLQDIVKGITSNPFNPDKKGNENASVNDVKTLLLTLFPNFDWTK